MDVFADKPLSNKGLKLSKPVVKTDKVVRLPQKISQPLKVREFQTPQLREVNLPVVAAEQSSMITAYKDLNQPQIEFALNQKKHFFIAFFIFFVLGLGIVMGKMATSGGGRGVAQAPTIVASQSMQKMIPSDAKVNSSLHYQREKVCYTEANGENVCATRESNQRY